MFELSQTILTAIDASSKYTSQKTANENQLSINEVCARCGFCSGGDMGSFSRRDGSGRT
jgi:hypothetical protein